MAGSRPKKGHRENSGYDRNIASIMPSTSLGSHRTEIQMSKGRMSMASRSAVTRESDKAQAIVGQLFSRRLRPASVVTEIVAMLADRSEIGGAT
jgi:hypothetical protein